MEVLSHRGTESDISSRDLAKDVARLMYLLGLAMPASLRFGITFKLDQGFIKPFAIQRWHDAGLGGDIRGGRLG